MAVVDVDHAFFAALLSGETILELGERIGAYREPWMAQGACIGSTVDFFPERGQPTEPAKAVCRGCPVREACLEFAMAEYCAGIWGATSETERRKLRRQRHAA